MENGRTNTDGKWKNEHRRKMEELTRAENGRIITDGKCKNEHRR